MTKLLSPTESHIQQCANALNLGELVAFPTETVFGLGAAVNQPKAVAGIFTTKGRPSDHPLIAHVAEGFDLTGWVDQSNPMMQILMDAFWPGPLSLVVPKGPLMSLAVTGGQSSVALRCPAHPVAQALLKAVGVPVAAPSANRFGKVSPTRASHVFSELNGLIPFILDGDIPSVGIESTIVSLLESKPRLLRPGAITPTDIQRVLGVSVLFPSDFSAVQVRVSGDLEKHYSPDANVLVLSAEQLCAIQLPESAMIVGWGAAFLTQAREQLHGKLHSKLVECENDPVRIAQALYCLLRQADEQGHPCVVFEQPAQGQLWAALSDRLKRASA